MKSQPIPHPTRFLLAAALILPLSGCPSFLSPSSNGVVDFKAIAVTMTDKGTSSSKVRLSWPSHSGAALYKIFRRTPGAEPQNLTAITLTEYEDVASPSATLSYSVEANAASGERVAMSAEKTVVVPVAEVGKVSAFKVNGTEASNTSPVIIGAANPTLSWSAATKANAYYVVVNQVVDGGGPGEAVFAALTMDTSLVVGEGLPQASLSFPGFPQDAGHGLTRGKNYLFSVTALRADSNDLGKATGLDAAACDAPAKIVFF